MPFFHPWEKTYYAENEQNSDVVDSCASQVCCWNPRQAYTQSPKQPTEPQESGCSKTQEASQSCIEAEDPGVPTPAHSQVANKGG